MFVSGAVVNDLNEYTLTTAFDVSTATYVDNLVVTVQDGSPLFFHFNNDGTKMILVGDDNDSLYEYTLATAFDVSTATIVDTLDIEDQDNTPRGLAFNNDGTKMFIMGFDDKDINE